MLDTVPSVSQNLFKFIFSQFIDENLHKFSELLKDNQNSDSSLYDSKACAINQYVVERSDIILEDTNPSWKRTAPLLPAFHLQANAEARGLGAGACLPASVTCLRSPATFPLCCAQGIAALHWNACFLQSSWEVLALGLHNCESLFDTFFWLVC